MGWEDNDETEFESALTVSFKTPFLSFNRKREREREREERERASHLSRPYTAVLQLSDSRQERVAWQLSETPALAFSERRENACKGRTECWILLILQEGFLSTNYSKVAFLWGNSLSSRIRTRTQASFCPWGEESSFFSGFIDISNWWKMQGCVNGSAFHCCSSRFCRTVYLFLVDKAGYLWI